MHVASTYSTQTAFEGWITSDFRDIVLQLHYSWKYEKKWKRTMQAPRSVDLKGPAPRH
jgi:hypothetical protein